MLNAFINRSSRSSKEKDSVLCVGLDPALPEQRQGYVIPSKYLAEDDDSEARLNFCLDVLEQVADFCAAAKMNEQYLRGFSSTQHQKLTRAIHEHGLVSIYDCKLGDIRDTVESALFYLHNWGYDGITFNPLPGNMDEVVKTAHSYDPQIGVLALTLMSNPEAEVFMRNARIDHKPLYLKIAEDVRTYNADGCVVGSTGYVTEDDIRIVRNIVGVERLLLVPGIGAQRGDANKAVKAGGENILINVGRDIIYSSNPCGKAEEYCRAFNNIRKKYRTSLP